MYEEMIKITYKNSNITYTKFSKEKLTPTDNIFFHYNFDPLANIATIIIDKIVKIANELKFFYAGIAFLYQQDRDYLILQAKNSSNIGSKNFVCYSTFCKELYKYIKKDKIQVIG